MLLNRVLIFLPALLLMAGASWARQCFGKPRPVLPWSRNGVNSMTVAGVHRAKKTSEKCQPFENTRAVHLGGAKIPRAFCWWAARKTAKTALPGNRRRGRCFPSSRSQALNLLRCSSGVGAAVFRTYFKRPREQAPSLSSSTKSDAWDGNACRHRWRQR